MVTFSLNHKSRFRRDLLPGHIQRNFFLITNLQVKLFTVTINIIQSLPKCFNFMSYDPSANNAQTCSILRKKIRSSLDILFPVSGCFHRTSVEKSSSKSYAWSYVGSCSFLSQSSLTWLLCCACSSAASSTALLLLTMPLSLSSWPLTPHHRATSWAAREPSFLLVGLGIKGTKKRRCE